MKKKVLVIILGILFMDQWSKIWVKTHLVSGGEIYIFDWFRIHFIENNGAAWGAEIGGKTGKLILTLFRIAALVAIGFWLRNALKNKTNHLLSVTIAMIFAGALGNIMDSVFYGVIFDHSYHQVATLFSENPYGHFLFGKVVDMLYFPFFEITFPSWVPFLAGKQFAFFNAIFNVADMSISTAVGIMIFFSKRLFGK